MNPIQQAEQALWTLTEHAALYYGEQHNTVIEGRAALTSLRSLQKEVEGVELPKADFFLDGGSTPCWYESSVRTAVAAALGRGAVPQKLRAALEHVEHIERRPGASVGSMQFHGSQAANLLRAMLAAAPSPEAPQQTDCRYPNCGCMNQGGVGPCATRARSEATKPTQAEAPSEPHPPSRRCMCEQCRPSFQDEASVPTQAEAPSEPLWNEIMSYAESGWSPTPARLKEWAFQVRRINAIQQDARTTGDLLTDELINRAAREGVGKWASVRPGGALHNFARAIEARVRAALATQQAVQGEPVEWGSTKTVGHLVRQLQTFDPATPITAACHADYEGKRVALTRPLIMSRERVAGRFIRQGDESVPYSLVIWSQQDEGATPPAPGQVARHDKTCASLLDGGAAGPCDCSALVQVEQDREDAKDYRWLLAGKRAGLIWRYVLSVDEIDGHDRVTSAIRAARSSEGGGNV